MSEVTHGWYLFAPAEQVNEATSHYVETIAAAARVLGRELRHVTRIADLPRRGDVLAIECKSAFKLLLLRPRMRTWLWMQGVVPEEARLQFGSWWRQALWTVFERATMPRARGVIMVSQAMLEHYRRKYGFGGASFVMPCANAVVSPQAFAWPDKYQRPEFVYAGSMHKWQCFELTLQVFGLVKARLPQARLTVLTGQQEQARQAIAAAGFADVTVDFVPLQELQGYLARFKYGFVLRQRHVVNQVSTPTKVSSYMAAGVIPVMTDAVVDYAKVLAAVEPMIISSHYDAAAIAQMILDLEAHPLKAEDVRARYLQCFADYFEHARYVPALTRFLESTGLAAG